LNQRTVSGTLFGFGVVAFLWPAVPKASATLLPGTGTNAYALGMASCAALVPAIAEWGGATGALFLMCLISAGEAKWCVSRSIF
jgi:hypothetical protein